MSITIALNNLSAESTESVNIAPLRTGWVKHENDSSQKGNVIEYRQEGDDLRYPHMFQLWRQPTNVFHSSGKRRWLEMPGFMTTMQLSSDFAVDDSVAGSLPNIPLVLQLRIGHGGVYMPDKGDVLTHALTLASMLYGSVTTGTPATDNITKLAIGGLELF